jgi:Family of unknown function (DUF6463)
MVTWAGRIMMIQGVLHLVVTGLLSLGRMGGWLTGEAWLAPGGLPSTAPAVAAFWLTLGSFGLPLILLGAVVARLGRMGRTVPAPVAWGLAAWGVACAAVLEPSPVITAVIPAAMLLIAGRSARRAATLAVAGPGLGTEG